MATAVLSLREEYWEEYELEDQDITYLYDYLLENETPLTSEELMPILVEQRISREKIDLEKKRLDGNEVYYPKDQFEVGKKLVFPALECKKVKLLVLDLGRIPQQVNLVLSRLNLKAGKNANSHPE